MLNSAEYFLLKVNKTMTTLFINGSPNKNGNTVALAQRLLRNQGYETLHLADYKIYGYGQDFLDDQFKEAIQKVFAVDNLVIGLPVRSGDR